MNEFAKYQSDARTTDGRNAQSYRALVDSGLKLARERSLDGVIRVTADAGLGICDAEFGAFLYSCTSDDGHIVQLSSTAGVANHWEKMALTNATRLFDRTMTHGESLCIDDLRKVLDMTEDERSGLPLRLVSYVAVPVYDAAGRPVGALVYGHGIASHFPPMHQTLLTQLAAQASAAMDVAVLAEKLCHEIALADQARAAQREYADRLTSVLEATTDGVVLMDSTWHFTYINDRAQQIVAPGRKVVGRSFLELFPDAAGSTFEQHYAEAMNERRTVEFTDYYDRLKIWAYIRVFPMAEGIAIFFQDVTEQRKAERDRDDVQKRLRQALDANVLGTWTWDRSTDLLDLDPRAANLFYAHTPVSRSSLREAVVAVEDRELTTEQLRTSLQHGGSYNAEYRVERPGSHPVEARWLLASGVPVFDEKNDSMTGMVGTVQDITDRKTSEAALRQSEKLAATGRLAATIAHEINNPLEAVTNLIYLAKTDPETPPSISRVLETADSELMRVAQIAQQTLGFYRDTTRPADINLTSLLESVRDLFARKLAYTRLTCHLDLHPNLMVFGLQGELRQVFSNLFVNAIDASVNADPAATICVRARAVTQAGVPGVAVLIVDHGTGIAPRVLERLYAPFLTTKASLGTGLGLWVTRGIIEKHSGTIHVRTSVAAPSGTVFRVFLPRESPNPASLTAAKPTLIH